MIENSYSFTHADTIHMTKQSQEIISLREHNPVNNATEQISFNIIADGMRHLVLFMSSGHSFYYLGKCVFHLHIASKMDMMITYLMKMLLALIFKYYEMYFYTAITVL